jgi:hypothetical protein
VVKTSGEIEFLFRNKRTGNSKAGICMRTRFGLVEVSCGRWVPGCSVVVFGVSRCLLTGVAKMQQSLLTGGYRYDLYTLICVYVPGNSHLPRVSLG